MENTVVKIENLVKNYAELRALDHLNLEIRQGEVFGLLGPNGSGKTTTISCLLSLLSFDEGTIEVFGKTMTPTSYDLKSRIGIIPQFMKTWTASVRCISRTRQKENSMWTRPSLLSAWRIL